MTPAETRFRQATEAWRRGDHENAVALCDRLLEETSGEQQNAAILNLKALALAAQGQLLAAMECLQSALRLQPEDAALQHHAARVSLALGWRDDALQYACAACKRQPDNAAYQYHLARVHLHLGELQQAQSVAQACVEREPRLAEAWVLLSELASQAGDQQRAVDCLESLLQQAPDDARGLALLGSLDPAARAQGMVMQCLEQIASQSGSEDERLIAGFALADAARQSGDHVTAFRHYQRVNSGRAQQNPFAIDAWESRVERIIGQEIVVGPTAGHSAAAAERLPGSQLVFVVGMPRSGTTLCEQVISAHPAVWGGGERASMEFIENALALAKADGVGTDLASLRQVYLRGLPRQPTTYQRFTDKAPRNFERIGLIKQLFPASRILWCLRHPLDTILSCYFQDFSGGQAFSYSLQHTARVYVGHIRLLKHWQGLYADDILTVDYTGLVQNLQAVAHGMADHIGLPFDARMLQPHRNRRWVQTASASQVRQPVHTASLNYWRHYRDELQAIARWLQQQGMLDEHMRSTAWD